MKKIVFAGFFGAFLAIRFMIWLPAPFAPVRVFQERLVFDDKAKQEFFAAFEATFDAGNPMAELWHATTNTIVEPAGLKNHYAHFSSAIKKITPNACPKKSVVDLTTQQDREYGWDRTFIVFDIENCKTETKGE